ncbi:MAG: type VI secretion system baseplate subunit TssE [Deltaproteobacteria bacterium HGW-Deltaproteobacteria-21]|nr:MAG: type VI secretion system baseplate subunit TssE [Deltaproteobacteria bacterium HGW-Deltaproteobacteria-21]
MREERLLERIHNTELNPERREGSNSARRVRSIMNHLQRILNTKHGSVPIAEDYGMPDFTDLPSAFSTESTHEVERTLKAEILKYEPRLQKVRISFESQKEDILSLRFKVEAQMIGEDGSPISFETVVDATGKVTVKD